MFKDISTIETMFYTLLGVAILAFFVWLCVKYAAARFAVIVVLLLGLYSGGIVSGVYINSYYTSSGGIIGKIESVIMPNSADIETTSSSLTIKINDVSLVKQADETYLAKVSISDTFKLDAEKDYVLSINGMETQFSSISSTSLTGKFKQVFYIDYALTNSMVKTLNYSMFMYETYTEFDIYIENDIDAVSLWNSYFDKNGCLITINEIENINDDVSSYVTITLMLEDRFNKEVLIPKGTNYVMPKALNNKFVYWEYNNSVVTEFNNIQFDLVLNAYYSSPEIIVSLDSEYSYNNEFLSIQLEVLTAGEDCVLSELSPNLYKNDLYKFVGYKYSVSGDFITEISAIKKNVYLIACFELK